MTNKVNLPDNWPTFEMMEVGYNKYLHASCHPMLAMGEAFKAMLQFSPELSFQQRVEPWMMECFGAMISGDKEERNHRFLEEALELVQACGCTQNEAHQLVDYVYGRSVGDKEQEVGGVMVTLAALCLAQNLDMHAAGETELKRIWTKVEQIRAKQAAKPKHSPLPVETSVQFKNELEECVDMSSKWAIVPTEPTEKMIDALLTGQPEHKRTDIEIRRYFTYIYKIAIEASPIPPKQNDPVAYRWRWNGYRWAYQEGYIDQQEGKEVESLYIAPQNDKLRQTLATVLSCLDNHPSVQLSNKDLSKLLRAALEEK